MHLTAEKATHNINCRYSTIIDYRGQPYEVDGDSIEHNIVYLILTVLTYGIYNSP
jgi:hypothetical protein